MSKKPDGFPETATGFSVEEVNRKLDQMTKGAKGSRSYTDSGYFGRIIGVHKYEVKA